MDLFETILGLFYCVDLDLPPFTLIMPEHFLDHSSDLKVVESGVRNKFKWTWLEEKDVNNDFLSESVRKLAHPGVAFCIYCQQRLDYGGRGKSFIKKHSESASHKRKRNAVKTTQSLPAVFQATASLERGETPAIPNPLPYGVAINVTDSLAFASINAANAGKKNNLFHTSQI